MPYFSPPPWCAVSKGCRSKRSRNVRIRRFGGPARQLAGRACGRKGLVGERRGSAVGQMLHKAKMQKPANRKATLKPCKEEVRNEEDNGCKCESDVSEPVSKLRICVASVALVQATGMSEQIRPRQPLIALTHGCPFSTFSDNSSIVPKPRSRIWGRSFWDFWTIRASSETVGKRMRSSIHCIIHP